MPKNLTDEEKTLTHLLFPLLKKYWKDFQKRVKKVKRDATPDAVHNLRVTIRRLRAIVSLFSELFPRIKTKSFSREMKKLMQPFGNLRDLHIQYDLLTVDFSSRRTFLSPYLEALSEKIKVGEDALANHIRALKFSSTAQLVEEILSLKKIRLPHKKAIQRIADTGCYYPVSRSILQKYLMNCFAYLPLVRKEENEREFHRLRVAVKKLRYLAEILQPLLAEDLPEDELNYLQSLQTVMGETHDRDVVYNSVQEYFAETDPNVLKRTAYRRWLMRIRAVRHKLYYKAITHLSRLEGYNFLP